MTDNKPNSSANKPMNRVPVPTSKPMYQWTNAELITFILGQYELHTGITGSPFHGAVETLRLRENNALEAIKQFLEWGAKTGSDRELFDDKFRNILTTAGIKYEEPL